MFLEGWGKCLLEMTSNTEQDESEEVAGWLAIISTFTLYDHFTTVPSEIQVQDGYYL